MTQIRKLLVATDFSPCAAAAVHLAIDLAKQFDAEILLLHVLPTLPAFYAFPDAVSVPVAWFEAARKQAQEHLSNESRRIHGPVVRTELREGAIHDSIVAAAVTAKADLIVVGTHGRTGLKHALLGSVAERVVRTSPIPVLTVRSRE